MAFPFDNHRTDPPNCTSGFLSLTILQSLLTDIFTPHSSELRFIPNLNFTCRGSVSRWMIGGRATGFNHLFRISLWQRMNNTNLYKGELPINDLSEMSTPNVYTFISEVEVDREWFIAISQSVSSSFFLYYLEGEKHQNHVINTETAGGDMGLGFNNTICNDILEKRGNKQLALPLLTPMDATSNCRLSSNFISRETLMNRALLIQNITYAPGQQTSAVETLPPHEPGTDGRGNHDAGTHIDNGTIGDQRDNDRLKRAVIATRQVGSVYVLCSDPFTTNGRVVSWTFAAQQQQLQNLRMSGTRRYPQLLILSSQMTSPSCQDATFNRTSTTMINNLPPIVLQTINLHNVTFNTSLRYGSGDVLGIYQPSAQSAVLLIGFDDIQNEDGGQAALRFDISHNFDGNFDFPTQFTARSDIETVRLQPLMTLSTTTIVIDPSRSIPCLLYTSPSPRDATLSRMPSSA